MPKPLSNAPTCNANWLNSAPACNKTPNTRKAKRPPKTRRICPPTTDRLKAEHAMLGKVADSAMADQSRYSRSEIRTLAAVDIRALRSEADNVAKRCRELDIQIQQANWENDIAEEEAG